MTEACDFVQEAMIKTIPKKKKCKYATWLSEKALQIAEKRREAKDKGEKERFLQGTELEKASSEKEGDWYYIATDHL